MVLSVIAFLTGVALFRWFRRPGKPELSDHQYCLQALAGPNPQDLDIRPPRVRWSQPDERVRQLR